MRQESAGDFGSCHWLGALAVGRENRRLFIVVRGREDSDCDARTFALSHRKNFRPDRWKKG
jgi:hypothetical protein